MWFVWWSLFIVCCFLLFVGRWLLIAVRLLVFCLLFFLGGVVCCTLCGDRCVAFVVCCSFVFFRMDVVCRLLCVGCCLLLFVFW